MCELLQAIMFLCCGSGDHRDLHSFPTRRSSDLGKLGPERKREISATIPLARLGRADDVAGACVFLASDLRSEEHTSELQSLRHRVCRLLLEKKNDAQLHI